MYLDIDQLRNAFVDHERTDMSAIPGQKNDILTGVLVPIIDAPGLPVVVTRRAHGLPHHSGEVCFPGGRRAEDDTSLAETALREAHEEVGLTKVMIVGRLSAMPVYGSDYRLVPFVGITPPEPLTPDPREVAEIHTISLLELLDRNHIDSLSYEWDGQVRQSPVFEVGDDLLFGATGHVLLELIEVIAPLCGKTVPQMQPGRYTWETLMTRLHDHS